MGAGRLAASGCHGDGAVRKPMSWEWKEKEIEAKWGREENGNLSERNPVTHKPWGLFQIALPLWVHPSHYFSLSQRW